MALETTASIADHRLVIQDAALPAHAERARVIVMWESAKPAGRRSPPPALAGLVSVSKAMARRNTGHKPAPHHPWRNLPIGKPANDGRGATL